LRKYCPALRQNSDLQQTRVLYVSIVLAHDRRRVLRFKVTEHPTAA